MSGQVIRVGVVDLGIVVLPSGFEIGCVGLRESGLQLSLDKQTNANGFQAVLGQFSQHDEDSLQCAYRSSSGIGDLGWKVILRFGAHWEVLKSASSTTHSHIASNCSALQSMKDRQVGQKQQWVWSYCCVEGSYACADLLLPHVRLRLVLVVCFGEI
jgi:hypothetical protein